MARFQLDIPEPRLREIETLMQETGTGTKKELVNNAITLLQWAVRQRQRGRMVCAVDEATDRLTELGMPILDRAALPESQAGVTMR